jgi:hypothetical protein
MAGNTTLCIRGVAFYSAALQFFANAELSLPDGLAPKLHMAENTTFYNVKNGSGKEYASFSQMK